MNKSESIKEIATALSKAQSEMTGAKKANTNPFFKSKYSDLSHVMEAISEPFSTNGLSFVQSPSFDNDLVTVTTLLMHSSGEWIEGTVCLPPTKKDAQGYGSAITYGKRYGLQAMVGVPSVDDDGNTATQQAKQQKPVESINTVMAKQLVEAFKNGDIEKMATISASCNTPTKKAVMEKLNAVEQVEFKEQLLAYNKLQEGAK